MASNAIDFTSNLNQKEISVLPVDSLKRPLARDEMTDEEFGAMIRESLEQAKNGDSINVREAFAILRSEVQ